MASWDWAQSLTNVSTLLQREEDALELDTSRVSTKRSVNARRPYEDWDEAEQRFQTTLKSLEEELISRFLSFESAIQSRLDGAMLSRSQSHAEEMGAIYLRFESIDQRLNASSNTSSTDSLMDTVTRLGESVTGLLERFEAVGPAMRALEQRVSDPVANVRSSVTEHIGRLAALEKFLTSDGQSRLQAQVQELQFLPPRLEQLQGQVDDSRTTHQSLSDSIAGFSRNLADHGQRLSDHTSRLSSLELSSEERLKLKEQVTELMEVVATWTNQLQRDQGVQLNAKLVENTERVAALERFVSTMSLRHVDEPVELYSHTAVSPEQLQKQVEDVLERGQRHSEVLTTFCQKLVGQSERLASLERCLEGDDSLQVRVQRLHERVSLLAVQCPEELSGAVRHLSRQFEQMQEDIARVREKMVGTPAEQSHLDQLSTEVYSLSQTVVEEQKERCRSQASLTEEVMKAVTIGIGRVEERFARQFAVEREEYRRAEEEKALEQSVRELSVLSAPRLSNTSPKPPSETDRGPVADVNGLLLNGEMANGEAHKDTETKLRMDFRKIVDEALQVAQDRPCNNSGRAPSLPREAAFQMRLIDAIKDGINIGLVGSTHRRVEPPGSHVQRQDSASHSAQSRTGSTVVGRDSYRDELARPQRLQPSMTGFADGRSNDGVTKVPSLTSLERGSVARPTTRSPRVDVAVLEVSPQARGGVRLQDRGRGGTGVAERSAKSKWTGGHIQLQTHAARSPPILQQNTFLQ